LRDRSRIASAILLCPQLIESGTDLQLCPQLAKPCGTDLRLGLQ
jgi:hypothetical protein